MTGLSIGTYIDEKIGGSPELATLIGEKFFPISTRMEVEFPFVVYQRIELSPDYTKDLLSGDTVNVAFISASDKHNQSIEVAEAVRSIFDGKRARKYGITDIKLISATEDLQEGTFTQCLIFSFKMDINN